MTFIVYTLCYLSTNGVYSIHTMSSLHRAAENFSTVNHFRYPANKAEFLLDDVECTGKEVSIGECPAAPFKTHNCRAYEIAGVECQISKGRSILHLILHDFLFGIWSTLQKLN